MSKYSPIWDTLKKTSECKITSPIALHKRVIKGVIRTKDSDTTFKFECSLKATKYRLHYTTKGNIIHFKLLKFDDVRMV